MNVTHGKRRLERCGAAPPGSQWRALEHCVLDRWGARNGSSMRLTRWLPLSFAISLALWSFGSASLMRALTPWVGTTALAAAGCYLGCVVLRIAHFSRLHAERLVSTAAALRRALYRMLSVLAGTVVVSAGFYFVAEAQLQGEGALAEPRLLWALTMGGLVLSLSFGELVVRLLESVEEAVAARPEDRAADSLPR